jgi:hypothetical protein
MLVFSDQGRIALRPDSELLIRRYAIDASGNDTRLEFDLVRGTLRQISGRAARQQPERYRLNTPVATIGVRGTDFLARASAQQTETYVHEGTIVVHPSSADCARGAECPVLASLSAADHGRYLQVSVGGVIERSFVKPEDVERIFGIRLATSREQGNGARSASVGIAGSGGAVGPSFGFLPLIFSDPNAQKMSGGQGTTAGPIGGAAPPASASSPVVTAPVPVSPPADVSVAIPTTLVWGRFSEPLQIPVTTLSYDEARQGRHVTVGELGQYALWRADPKGTIFPALTGQVSLSLAMHQAYYRTDVGSVQAAVSYGVLLADFDLARFSTELRLQASGGGPSTVLTASGRINDEGLFVSVAADGSQRVAGAFSRDGKEAGYLFNKTVGNGVFQGITLWGVRK